jgi:DNA-binding Lrp family transcriptional regulator
MTNEDPKQAILDFLLAAEGKGTKTIVEIGKATGLKRRDCSKHVRELEEEGKIAAAGVMAGVAGYKAVK